MRLTQKEIIDHMRDGWELGVSSDGRWWLQKPHLCCGGETKDIHAGSGHALRRKKLIKLSSKPKDPFWLSRFILAEQKGLV